jgi:hypothetical protein
MATNGDSRELLQVLKTEELFLKIGGYDRPPISRPSGPSLIFQDTPACPNSGSHKHSDSRVPCSKCALIDLVPVDRRDAQVPCRHIPLNGMGETVDTLYRWGTLQETKLLLADWLKSTIEELLFIKRAHPPESAGKNYHAPDAT